MLQFVGSKQMESVEAYSSQAYNLLTNNQALKTLRSDSSAFVKTLANNNALLKDLLDISFRPDHFQTTRNIKLTPEKPQLATETLCNLYEDFINLLAYDKIVNRDRSVEDAQMQQERNSTSNIANSQEFVNLKYLHNAFESPQIDDASIGNLSRIIGPLYYNCPQRVIKFYQCSSYHKKLFFKQLWRRQIVDFFCKLMEIQVGSQFFKEFKHNFITQFYQIVKENLNGGKCHQWLDSTRHLHKFITEKIQQRYDGSKYNVLLQVLSKNDQVLIKMVNQSFQNYSIQTILVCQQWLEQSLKKDTVIMSESNSKGDSTLKRRKSYSSLFYVDEKPKNVQHRVTQQYLASISSFLKLSNQKFVEEANPLALFLISFYRLIYYWVKNVVLWTQFANGIKMEWLVKQLINQSFFETSFKAIENHPRSTILHNQIKDLILVCLQNKRISQQFFMKEDSLLRKILTSWLPRKQGGLQIAFGAQSYHIYLQMIKMEAETSEEILDLMANQKLRRQKLIGGVDPRKLQDNLRSSANIFSSSSQEQSQQQIEIKISSVQKFAQFVSEGQSAKKLKLANVCSIQKSCQQIKEESGNSKKQGSDSD